MTKIAGILIALLWVNQASGLDAGDVQAFIQREYGMGKVISVAVDDRRIARIEFSESVPRAQRKVIEEAVSGLDLASPGGVEVNEEIRRELASLEKSVEDDGTYMETKAKLIRAMETPDLDLKKARLEAVRRQR